MTTLTSYDLQAKVEQSLLAVLSVNAKMLKSSDINLDMFFYDTHRNLYISMKKHCLEDSIDLLGIFEDVGEKGFEVFSQLQESYVSAANYDNDLARFEDFYRKRKSKEFLEEMTSGSIDFNELLKRMNRLNESSSDISDQSFDVMDIYELVTSESKRLEFADFKYMQDRVNFIENTLNVIAARPSVGKSAFALNLMNDISKSNKYKCIYINMEMTEKEIYERLIGINTGLIINEFPKANLECNASKRKRMCECLTNLKNRHIKIINHSMSIDGIGRTIVHEKRKKDNQGKHLVIFIDYLGYIRSKKNTNDREKMGDIVRQLQLMTKDYNCTIFLLAQINRDGAEKPKLENLKDTGELEQSGHCVMILDDMDSDPLKAKHRMEVLIAKNRSGSRGGKLLFDYDRPSQKFKTIEYHG